MMACGTPIPFGEELRRDPWGLILSRAELVAPRLASSLHYKMSFDAEFVRVDPLVTVEARVQGRVALKSRAKRYLPLWRNKT